MLCISSARLAILGSVVCLRLLCPTSGCGALLAYEPFNYPAGIPLVGRTNGTGFSSGWEPGGYNSSLHRLFRTKSGTLRYPGLAVEGTTHVSAEAAPGQGIAGLGRLLATDLAVPNTTCYLSFLHRPDAEEEFASIVVGTGEGNELAIGKSASTGQYYIAHRGGAGRVLSGVQAIVGRTRFIVVKMEFRQGPDRFTLYVDPMPGKPEPSNGFVKNDLDLEHVNMIFLYSRAAWSVDEIRVGTTWADVTPALPKIDPPK